MSKAVKRLPRDHLTPAEVERAIAELEVERAHVFDRRGRQVAVFVEIVHAVVKIEVG